MFQLLLGRRLRQRVFSGSARFEKEDVDPKCRVRGKEVGSVGRVASGFFPLNPLSPFQCWLKKGQRLA